MKSLIEVAVAGAVVPSLFALRFGSALDPEILLSWSVALIAGCLAVGLPAVLGYHFLLLLVVAVSRP